MGGYARGFHGRDNHNAIANLLGVTAIATYNAENLHAAGLGFLESRHNVRADVLFKITAADGQHQHGVIAATLADLEPAGKHRVPAFIVGTGGKFGYVVRRRIGLDAAQLPEVVNRVAAITGAATHAKQEQPATTVPQGGQFGREFFYQRCINGLGNFYSFFEIRFGMHGWHSLK